MIDRRKPFWSAIALAIAASSPVPFVCGAKEPVEDAWKYGVCSSATGIATSDERVTTVLVGVGGGKPINLLLVFCLIHLIPRRQLLRAPACPVHSSPG